MTKIIIEESITSTIKTGVGEHTKTLNSLIKNLDYEYEIVSNKLVELIKNATLKRIFYLIWLNTMFVLKLLFQKKGTIVIYTSYLPILKLKKIKQIGIIHDVCGDIMPDKLSKLNRINNKLLNYFIINKADRILTVSNTVKNEIVKFYKYPVQNIFVVYNTFSLDTNFNLDENKILNKYNLINNKNKYLLSVSSMNPNKNIELLLNVINEISKIHPEIKLVLTGGKDNVVKQYKKLIDNENIVFTGYLDKDELKIIYKNAFAYIFPSFYEGFGIPIIDAQLFNCPVICSNIPVFSEVANDSAIYAEISVDDFAKKITSLIEDNKLYQDINNNANENIKRFGIDVLIKQLNSIINSLFTNEEVDIDKY